MVDLYGLDTNAGSFTTLKEPGGKLLLSKGVFLLFSSPFGILYLQTTWEHVLLF